MRDEADISLAESVLLSAGLTVERVPTAKRQTCDLRAHDGHDHYLVEVKGFHDDDAIAKSLRTNETHFRTESLDIDSTIDTSIAEAVKQIDATAESGLQELRLIFLISRNKIDGDLVSRQMRSVLYGVRCLIPKAAANPAPLYECLHFAESAFFRHRSRLDGAFVVDAAEQLILCANDHADHKDRLLQSLLGKFIVDKGVLYDQAQWEKIGFLVADCNICRNEEHLVQRYVEQKYDLGETNVMQFNRCSGFATLTNTSDKKSAGRV
jgi:hypothetical protein